MIRTIATTAAFFICLFSSHASADADLCRALEATARTIVGGKPTIPAAQVMMDGSVRPPLLIPGTSNPRIGEKPYSNGRDIEVSYEATAWVGRNAEGAQQSSRSIYKEWVRRVATCYPSIEPLQQQDNFLEERTIFETRNWRVTADRGGGISAVGITAVSIDLSLTKDISLN
jgi:hypothetical protein